MSCESSTSVGSVDTGELLEIGRRSGLAAVGVTTAEVLQPALSVIELRKRAGLAGDMQFTYRNPARSCDPTRLLPSARSLIAAAWAYGHWRQPKRSDSEAPAGAVARYTWHDHYADLRQALQPMADQLMSDGYRALVVADTNALVDRNVAWSAGLGWYGKNSNLLLPGSGSWYVLGAIVTDAELEPTGPPMEDGCGSCSQCIDDCPTEAIIAPGVVDATRCLAWLVQAGGSIPIEFREAVGDRLYGCDDCQDVCPPNRTVDRPDVGNRSDTQPQPQPQPQLQAEASQAMVDIEWVLTAPDDEIEARHGRWYIADRNIDVIRRTALVVLGNTAGPDRGTSHAAAGAGGEADGGADGRGNGGVERLLTRYLTCKNEVLRIHAAWAARRLGRDDLVDGLAVGSIPEDERNAAVRARFSASDWRPEVGQ